MSQSKPKFAEIDFSDRRAPLPITNLPVTALSDDTDPTREIRTLIEQLQQTARDARAQARASEDERNEMATQLETARRQNEELRAHFVEITSLIRERDAALQEVERHARAVTEAQTRIASAERTGQELRRQCDEAARQRDDLARQRDDLNRRIDAVTHASQETNRCFNEAQRQIFSIRQARDTAQAQNTELLQKLSRAEDTVADLQYLVEEMEKKIARAQEAEAKLGVITTERNEAVEKLQSVSAELDQAMASLAEISTTHASAMQAGAGHETALAEAHEQLQSVISERDLLASQVEGYVQEIDSLRTRPDGSAVEALRHELQGEISALQHECATSELRVQVLSREVIDLRNQLQDRSEHITSLQRTAGDSSENLSRLRTQFDSLLCERDVAQRMRDEAALSLASAQKQIDKIIRDRDLTRQQSTESVLALEAQVEALRAQLQAVESAAGYEGGAGNADISEMARLLDMRDQDRRDLADRLEQQRTETIDLATQLRAAQEQIKILGSQLAEARLQAKQGGRWGAAVPRQSQTPVIPTLQPESFATTETHDGIRAMRRCYQAYLKTPAESNHLAELHAQAEQFSERAREAGLIALHRLSAAFAGLASDLHEYPEQVNPATLRTVGQTIEFLTTLLKVKDLSQAKDPAKALVFAVDDDEDNCDCIRMAMETAMMQTRSAQDPIKALCELADTPCDLIFLDVSLPGMNGFELCAEIRQLALHATTPIIFLSGLSSAENRMHSSLSGGNEFISKPFLLCELTLKALTLILKAQLHLA